MNAVGGSGLITAALCRAATAPRRAASLRCKRALNLLNSENHAGTQEFVDTMFSHSLLPCITKPTRVNSSTATLIDNIFSSDLLNKDTIAGIFYTDITDHFPVFMVDYSTNIRSPPEYIRSRRITPENLAAFQGALRAHDWSAVTSCTDPQQAYTVFHSEFCSIYSDIFPVKNIKLGYRTKKPWLSEGLKKSIKLKNKLYVKQKRSCDPDLKHKYKAYRNRLNYLLKKAERDHYEKLFQENKGNLKKAWSIIREVINKKTSSNTCSRFVINNNITTNKNIIADGFNSYFANVGPTLAKNIPHDSRCPTTFIPNRNENSMFMTPVVEHEVKSIIRMLKTGSSGWDSISAVVVKATAQSIVSPLTHVINLSLSSGVFPQELKIARIIPLFKSGDPMQLNNYRPVSVLPVFSKVFERIMYNRLLSFINKNKLLYNLQFGFRPGHSPNLALIYLVDRISSALEKGDYVLGIFLDFSKAFDTVDHSILLNKLEYYGIRGVPLQWFRSYLDAREQFVEFDGQSSSKQFVSCGVPQGSILGPLLFLIYINDLALVSPKLFSILFADDSNMFISGKNPNDLVRDMNAEMHKVTQWLTVNKLSLNVKKTHFMLFRKKKLKVSLDEELVIKDTIISRVEFTKFLGVYIDSCLTWNKHIQHVNGKVARGLGILCKGRKYFTKDTLTSLYYAFVYPHLTYCIEVWGCSFISYLTPLTRLLKRAVRIIMGADRRAHTAPLFHALGIMNITQIYVYFAQIFMFKYSRDMLPAIFSDFFVFNSSVHNYSTRQSCCLHVQLAKTDMRSRTIRFKGVTVLNYFSSIIEQNCSIYTYKRHLKRHILSIDVAKIVYGQ